MSDYFDRIEDHLLDAVERHANSRRTRRRARQPVTNRLPRLPNFSASVVLTTIVALTSIGVAGFFLASVRPAKQAPAPGALSSHQACGTTGAQRLSHEPPPKSLLSILGVLRRPQTPQDKPPMRLAPPVLRTGSPQGLLPQALLRRHAGLPVHARITKSAVYVYWNYIRRAVVLAHVRYYLIPFVAGTDVAEPIRCSHPFVGVWFFHVARGFGEGGCCLTPSDILAGDSGGTSGGPGTSGVGTGSTLSFVVPDGVASVTLRFKGGPANTQARNRPRNIKRPHAQPTVTTKPIGNVVAVTVPPGVNDAFQRTTVWRSENGRIIKTIR